MIGEECQSLGPVLPRAVATYHLLDASKALAVEAEGLFKQDFVLHRPLVRERCEISQISQRLLHIVFVPQQHPQSLWGESNKNGYANDTEVATIASGGGGWDWSQKPQFLFFL